MDTTRKLLWRWRRNPLRRRSDRVESWVTLSAAVALAAAAPTAGVVAANDIADRTQDELGGHRATAVLQEDARTADGLSTDNKKPNVLAEAEWKLPDGSTRTGEVPVRAGTHEDARVPVWLDDQGSPQQPPPSSGEVLVETVAVGSLAGSGAAGVVIGGFWFTRRRIDACRARAWEREWAEVGPQWTQRA